MASKRRARRRKTKPVPTSSWNGPDKGSAQAATFHVLVDAARRLQQTGAPEALAVADIVRAAAWALNRDDRKALAELGGPARRWLQKAAPLLSDADLKRYKGKGPKLPSRTEAEAYARAIAAVELLGAKVSPAEVAWNVSLAIQSPLRRFLAAFPGEAQTPAGAKLEQYVRNTRDSGRALDAETTVRRALRIAGHSAADVTRLANTLGKRETRRARRGA